MPTSENLSTAPSILIPEIRLRPRIEEMAREITQDFAGKDVVAICVLKGSFIFYADLLRKLDLNVSCEFLGVSSYGNKMVSSGEVKVTLDINDPLEGKHILIVEDIVDSGLTLNYITDMLRTRKPATIKSCALLLKPDHLKTEVKLDYVGFKIGSEFVVGYGIDYQGKHRGLPYIGYIEQEH